MVQPKNRRLATEAYADIAKPDPVNAISDLPQANADNQGLIRFVTAENEPYYSNGTTWSSVSQGAQGVPGPAGAGVPSGGEPLQIIRKNSVGTTTEWATLTKSLVGLSNVDNSSDMNKPVSTMQKLALDEKLDAANLPDEVDSANKNLIEDKASLTAGALSAAIADLSVQGPGILAVDHDVTSIALGSADQSIYGVDATPAINALIASVSAAGGGKVILPPGEIRLDANIVPKSGVMLVGSGIGKTVLLTQEYGFLHTSADPSDVLTDFHLRDLTADGRRNGDGAGWKGWHGQYHQRCSWVDVEFKNYGMTGLGPDYLRDCWAMRVRTENTGRANDGTMPSGNGIGFAVGGSWLDGSTEENFVIMGCHVHGAKRFGIMWEGGTPNVAGQAYGGAVVIGNTVTGCGSGGINASGGRNPIIQGNYTYGNVGHGILVGLGTLPNSAPAWRALVNGNQSHSNGGSGIVYDESKHAKLGDLTKITGNVCTNNGDAGILIKTGLSDVAGIVVTDNTGELNVKQGIRVESANGKKIYALKIDDNLLSRNYGASGGATPTDIAQLSIIGADIQGGSISNNVFHHTADRQCIALGSSTSPATLTGVKIQGNVPAKASVSSTILQHANATLTDCHIRDNPGYFLGLPTAQIVGASPWTYTAGATPETVYVRGGVVTAIRKQGVAVFVSTDNSVPLEPNEAVVIEYTGIPVVYRERKQ